MKQPKTFNEQMLEQYPNMYKVDTCSICKTDLRYHNKIHRIYNLMDKKQLEWYCDKCYVKYKEKTKMKSLEEIVEENKKADNVLGLSDVEQRYNDIKELLQNVELTKENYDKIIDFIGRL